MMFNDKNKPKKKIKKNLNFIVSICSIVGFAIHKEEASTISGICKSKLEGRHTLK